VTNLTKNLKLNAESEFKIIFNKVKSQYDAVNIEVSTHCMANIKQNKKTNEMYRLIFITEFLYSFHL